MLRLTISSATNAGRALHAPSRKIPSSLPRRASFTSETPRPLSRHALSYISAVDARGRATFVRESLEKRGWWRRRTEQQVALAQRRETLARTIASLPGHKRFGWTAWLSGPEKRDDVCLPKDLHSEELWDGIRNNKHALLSEACLFDFHFNDFHTGKLEGFEAYAIVLCHAAKTFREGDATVADHYALVSCHLVNVLNHLRAATLAMPSLAQPIRMHMVQQASLILKLLMQGRTTEAHIYVGHLHNELNAIVHKQPAPCTLADVQELGRFRSELLCSVEKSEFKLFKKALDKLNDNFPGLTARYLRVAVTDIVIYLPRLVSQLTLAGTITKKESHAIDCKITALARSVALPAQLNPDLEKARPEGLAELAGVYHLHREWLNALKQWIDSQ